MYYYLDSDLRNALKAGRVLTECIGEKVRVIVRRKVLGWVWLGGTAIHGFDPSLEIKGKMWGQEALALSHVRQKSRQVTKCDGEISAELSIAPAPKVSTCGNLSVTSESSSHRV